MKLSQCGGDGAGLLRMEGIILEKLQGCVTAVTPLTFVCCFYELFACKSKTLDVDMPLSSVILKLELLMCNHKVAKYKVCVQFHHYKLTSSRSSWNILTAYSLHTRKKLRTNI